MTNIAMENHNVYSENPLFLWPSSIATFNYQKVSSDNHTTCSVMARVVSCCVVVGDDLSIVKNPLVYPRLYRYGVVVASIAS